MKDERQKDKNKSRRINTEIAEIVLPLVSFFRLVFVFLLTVEDLN